MAETVAITTQDLEPAVRLRDAFVEEGFRVELLTAGEKLAEARDPVLLILTGGLDDKRARRLQREAAEAGGLSVIGLADLPQDALPDPCRKRGLTECFAKPVDVQEVVLAGRRLIERRRLRQATGIIGDSEPMMEVLERVVQMAPVNATVLITGESGTGKELVARGLHALSTRAGGPFIAANVAALSETLLESELFGHEKGSFTGAVAQRKGLFELADKGTLFLDEIYELPLSLQPKFLRAIQEREVTPLGSNRPIPVDVRIIAATHRDLRTLIRQGLFREDLFYRLNVVPIRLPPLRERTEDIPSLVRHFLTLTSAQGLPTKSIDTQAMERMKRYRWPGNVRELENLVRRLAALYSQEVISTDIIESELADSAPASPQVEEHQNEGLSSAVERHLKDYFAAHKDGIPAAGLYDRVLREVERPLISLSLSATRGNQIKAAQMLGLNRNTLRKKIRELDIQVIRGLK